ncbi:hypothetical protein VH567_06435 [Sphingomonas sp. 4RDLI-65]|uniref:hypothetical protein n=1 Tax=Sphingomonas sp. 4RDLI-65 TaxID=3111641 RepID=UPI003C1D7A9D
MTKLDRLDRTEIDTDPAAKVLVRIGTHTTFDASITTVGLLSVGVLVSGILLSSAVIVLAAGLKGRRKPLATLPAEVGR